MSCRGQIGTQVVEHLSVEYVRDLAAYQAKELIDHFGAATGVIYCVPSSCEDLLQHFLLILAANAISLLLHHFQQALVFYKALHEGQVIVQHEKCPHHTGDALSKSC